jgi:hypothetical protein
VLQFKKFGIALVRFRLTTTHTRLSASLGRKGSPGVPFKPGSVSEAQHLEFQYNLLWLKIIMLPCKTLPTQHFTLDNLEEVSLSRFNRNVVRLCLGCKVSELNPPIVQDKTDIVSGLVYYFGQNYEEAEEINRFVSNIRDFKL